MTARTVTRSRRSSTLKAARTLVCACPYRVLFEVRVIESFRGTANAGDIVGVRTGFGGGDCGYTFKIGGKYLIY